MFLKIYSILGTAALIKNVNLFNLKQDFNGTFSWKNTAVFKFVLKVLEEIQTA